MDTNGKLWEFAEFEMRVTQTLNGEVDEGVTFLERKIYPPPR